MLPSRTIRGEPWPACSPQCLSADRDFDGQAFMHRVALGRMASLRPDPAWRAAAREALVRQYDELACCPSAQALVLGWADEWAILRALDDPAEGLHAIAMGVLGRRSPPSDAVGYALAQAIVRLELGPSPALGAQLHAAVQASAGAHWRRYEEASKVYRDAFRTAGSLVPHPLAHSTLGLAGWTWDDQLSPRHAFPLTAALRAASRSVATARVADIRERLAAAAEAEVGEGPGAEDHTLARMAVLRWTADLARRRGLPAAERRAVEEEYYLSPTWTLAGLAHQLPDFWTSNRGRGVLALAAWAETSRRWASLAATLDPAAYRDCPHLVCHRVLVRLAGWRARLVAPALRRASDARLAALMDLPGLARVPEVLTERHTQS